MFKGLSEGTVIFLIGQAMIIGVALLKTYLTMMLRLKDLDMRVKSVEKQDDKILSKLEEMNKTLNEIQIELNNKKDKE